MPVVYAFKKLCRFEWQLVLFTHTTPPPSPCLFRLLLMRRQRVNFSRRLCSRRFEADQLTFRAREFIDNWRWGSQKYTHREDFRRSIRFYTLAIDRLQNVYRVLYVYSVCMSVWQFQKWNLRTFGNLVFTARIHVYKQSFPLVCRLGSSPTETKIYRNHIE